MPILKRGLIIVGIFRHENKDGKNRYLDMKTKTVKIVKDRWSDELALEISHNGWQTTSIGNLDLEDLKKLKRIIEEFIRNHENNSNKR